VFDKAEALIEKSRARAEALADEVQPEALRQLLYFLVDIVLAEESREPEIAQATAALVPLPVIAAT
jgi:geranylgeranyl diphosphate synthase, type II